MAKNKWGDWEIINEIDGGGQGTVYKVRDSNGRLGALKRLKNPNRLERFKAEVDAVSRLKHKNIVPLITANTTKEPFYAVFEYEPGGALSDLTPEDLQNIPLTQRLHWCEDIVAALTAAHSVSCVHRDVKPENILLSEDRRVARLCDFGLVYMDGEERITASMEQVGSRYYIPPECEDGRADQVSPRSDLYSLGKVLYYLVSGGNFFAREQHREPSNDLSQLLSDPYVEAISSILDRTVTENVNSRLASAAEFGLMLSSARQKMEQRLPVAGISQTYRCIFCCEGKYKEICVSGSGRGGTSAHNEGYSEGNIGNEFMVYMECDVCGNCQRFKLKYGGEKWFPKAHAKWKERY
jgi:serine/threonine protein kinase